MIKKSNDDPTVASIVGEGSEWYDWIGTVDISEFIIPGADDFIFKNAHGHIDHSDLKNVADFPLAKFNNSNEPDFMSKYNAMQQADWTGFYLTTLDLQLPSFLNQGGPPMEVLVTDLIVDDQGLSMDAALANVMGIGSQGDFRFSLDSLKLAFVNNAFSSGRIAGQLRIPLVHSDSTQSFLAYTSTLSYSNSNTNQNTNALNNNNGNKSFAYNFTIVPHNIYVPLFVGQIDFNNNTNIQLNYANDSLSVSGALHGQISITDPHGITGTNLNIPLVAFQGINISSSEPFISGGNFSPASPQKFIGGELNEEDESSGFSITPTEISLAMKGASIGLVFKQASTWPTLTLAPSRQKVQWASMENSKMENRSLMMYTWMRFISKEKSACWVWRATCAFLTSIQNSEMDFWEPSN